MTWPLGTKEEVRSSVWGEKKYFSANMPTNHIAFGGGIYLGRRE